MANGTKLVSVEGKRFRVPSDATPDEIDQLSKGTSTSAAKTSAAPGYFTSENFQTLAGEAGGRELEYARRAADPSKGFPYKAGSAMMSGVESIVRVADQVAAGLLDPKTAAAMALSKLDPAITGAYFMTSGSEGTKKAAQDIHEHGWTPENAEQLFLSLSAVAGGGATAESPKAGRTTSGLSKVGELRQAAKERIQPFARKVTGTESAVKETVAKTAEKHGEALTEHRADTVATIKENLYKQRKARMEIDQEKITAVEKNKAIEAKNAEQRAAVEKRGETAKTVDEQSVALGKSIEQVESKVYAAADQKFNEVRAKVGNPEEPPDELIASVKNVEKNILQEIPENIKEFRSILKMAGKENEGPLSVGGGGAVAPGEPGYEAVRKAYVEEGLLEEGKPLTWDKLQSLKSRIDARLRSRTAINGDLKRGLFSVRDSIVDEMGKMAEANGAGTLWTDAKNFWRQMREDFHEPTGPSGSGSPVAQALDAVDPKNIRQPFLLKQSAVGNRAIDILRKYPQYGGTEAAAQAEVMLKSHETMLGLPKKATETALKTTPEAHVLPTDKPIPARPETPTVDIHKVALAQIEKAARSWKTWSQWDARRIASSAMGEIIGQLYGQRLIGAGLGYTAGTLVPKYIGTLLDKPAVAEWLARTPKAELDLINKIPSRDKIIVVDTIADVAVEQAKTNPVRLSPEARNLLGPKNVARIVAASGAVAGSQVKNRKDAIDLLRSTAQ